MAESKELEIGRDTLIFQLQHLGFIINVQKVCILPEENHRITWDYNKFEQNGIIPLRRESSKNSNAMSENIGPKISVCKGGLSVDRNIILNCSSSPASPSHVLLPTETTNRRIKYFPFLQKNK